MLLSDAALAVGAFGLICGVLAIADAIVGRWWDR